MNVLKRVTAYVGFTASLAKVMCISLNDLRYEIIFFSHLKHCPGGQRASLFDPTEEMPADMVPVESGKPG